MVHRFLVPMAQNGPVKPMFEILMIVMKYSIGNVQEGYDVIEPRDVSLD